MSSSPTHLTSDRLGVRDWWLLVETALALTGASLAITVLPFRYIARGASASRTARHPQDPAIIRRAGRAVDALSRRLPWKTVCFQKGLALHWMLRRRGVTSLLHYGVDRDAERGLRAHVWVSVAGDNVMGGELAAEFACLAVFPPADASAFGSLRL